MTRITTINDVAVTVHGNISNEELTIYLNMYQATRKEKMVRAVVSVTAFDIGIKGYSTVGFRLSVYGELQVILLAQLTGGIMPSGLRKGIV